jgi:hypothetical protein
MKSLLVPAGSAMLLLAVSAHAESLQFSGNADRQDVSDSVAMRLKAPADFPDGEPSKLELRWRGTVVASRAPGVSGQFSMRLAYFPGASVRVGESVYNFPVGVEGELAISHASETSRWLIRQENYGSIFAQARHKAGGVGFVLPVGFVRQAEDPSRVHTLLTIACVMVDGSLQCGQPRFAVEISDRRYLPHAGSHEELLPDSMRARIEAIGSGHAAPLAPTPPFAMDCCYGAWRCKCTTNCACNYVFCNNCEASSCVSMCEDAFVCLERCFV